MPGSPASKTNEPGTNPPPKTWSISLIAVVILATFDVATVESLDTCVVISLDLLFTFPPLPQDEASFLSIVSTKLFQESQFGHFPKNDGLLYPHCWQIN